MAKYHINSNGVPGPCRSEKGLCPYEAHFESIDEAFKYADIINEEEYIESLKEIISTDNYIDKESLNNKTKQELEEEISTISQRNYEQSELKKMSNIDLMKLSGITNSPGRLTELEVCKKSIERFDDVLPSVMSIPKFMSEEAKQRYKIILKEAMPESKQDFPAHLVWEDAEYIKAWTSDPKYLDFITIRKSDKRTTFEEIKDLTKEAQISNTAIKQNSDGSLEIAEDSYTNDKVKAALKNIDPINDSYTNKKLEITQDESIAHFVRMHISKNCSKFSFKDNNGRINTVYLTSGKDGDVKKDVEKIKKAGVGIELWVRQNNKANSTKATKSDKARFQKEYGQFFKDGIAKTEFTYRDLDYSKIKAEFPTHKNPKKKTYIRIGEFYIEQEGLSSTDKINIDNFRKMKPLLSGRIFLNKSQMV